MRSRSILKVKLTSGWTAAVIGIVVLMTSGALRAQSTVSLTGKATSLKGQDLVVETNSGPAAIKLIDKTVIRGEVPIKFSDITPGMYVGATAAKQPDGTFRASRLHIFSEDQRGTGEGHRPLSSAPGSGLTMTNANVETWRTLRFKTCRGVYCYSNTKAAKLKCWCRRIRW